MMDIVSTVLKWNLCLLDEVVVFSKTYDGHLAQLSSVSAAIKKAGLRLQVNKMLILETKLKMLGHIVDKDEVYSDPEKVP